MTPTGMVSGPIKGYVFAHDWRRFYFGAFHQKKPFPVTSKGDIRNSLETLQPTA
jgi:hypothetical protein